MKERGFFLLAVVLCVATHAMAQPARDHQVDRMTDQLWWISSFREISDSPGFSGKILSY